MADVNAWDKKVPITVYYFDKLAKLAVFADAQADICFGNVVSDWPLKTSEMTKIRPGERTISFLYDNLPESSSIRALMVDLYHGHADKASLGKLKQSTHSRDFIVDVLISYKAAADGEKWKPRPSWHTRCDYHMHNDEVSKCK